MNSSHHLSHLLANWFPKRDKFDWVLASIYKTQGPCYRKAGAMMLFSSQGDQLGMLSGGCLESDIAINARKVMQSGTSQLVCYDGSDEDDLSFHLGIGCGGTIYIMLQLINSDNNYLALDQVFTALKQRKTGYYYQSIVKLGITERAYFEEEGHIHLSAAATIINYSNEQPEQTSLTQSNNNEQWLASPIIPEPHLLVVGGGIDARPLVNMAKQLGWKVSLWDPRPANARKEYFSGVDHIIQGQASVLKRFVIQEDVNAAVLMSHNVEIDANALTALATSPLKYLALLGPTKRKQQVLNQAKVRESKLPFVFSGPAGLDIGGSLPESIALSILSECHAYLHNKKAKSFSKVL